MRIGFVGFGEAGPVFAHTLARAGATIAAYDLRQDDPDTRTAQLERTRAHDAEPLADAASVARASRLVISTVTASEAVAAVRSALPGIGPGTTWFDLNSVAPETKAAVGEIVRGAGGRFVEAVAMDTVPEKGVAVPILVCGPDAAAWADTLNGLGLSVTAIGEDHGRAATVKLMRSILIKGMEALFAECVEAASVAGVERTVLDSLCATYPELDWHALAGYQLARASRHGARRAAEMQECAALVASLGVEPIMTRATAERQQSLADRALGAYRGEAVEDFVRAMRGAAGDPSGSASPAAASERPPRALRGGP